MKAASLVLNLFCFHDNATIEVEYIISNTCKMN